MAGSIAQKNGIASLSRRPPSRSVSLIVSLLPFAVTPLIVFAFLLTTSFQPTMSVTNAVTGEFIDGLASRFMAATKLWAVSGAPFENFIPERIVKVYVLPSFEMTG